MRDRSRASFTADAACAARAHGALHPDPRLRNPDHLARVLVGMPLRALLLPVLRRTFVAQFERRAPGVYFVHQARTKRLDAIALAELERGVDQMVVLGAGFDSRAYRFANRMRGARVFEVDHPATSAEKRRRVRKALGREPPHVTYVAVDFARDPLTERLAAGGFTRDARTFFLWEGVCMYLTPDAVDAMLSFVAGCGRGSSIALDHLWKSALERPDAAMKKHLDVAARHGEPYQFGVDPDDLAPLFARHAMTLVASHGHDDLARELVGSDGRPWGEVARGYGVAHARA